MLVGFLFKTKYVGTVEQSLFNPVFPMRTQDKNWDWLSKLSHSPYHQCSPSGFSWKVQGKLNIGYKGDKQQMAAAMRFVQFITVLNVINNWISYNVWYQ